MQTSHHLSRAWTASGLVGACCSFCLAAFFGADVLGEYFLNTSYFFNMAWAYEFTIMAAAAVVGVAAVALTYYKRR